ncbi:VOC family protein [Candidatus Curtissbacteria bacterium]|nr:VOC family protein [Candidatus Curtissbacteria bacterium]
MIKGLESILIGSQKASKLADFYTKTVGLKKGSTWVNDENGEEGIELFVGKQGIYVMDHSKVKGKAKDPNRVILNIEVDDVEKETKRLKKAKVKVVQDVYHMEGYGLIATFADPEGNYFQFVQVKAK